MLDAGADVPSAEPADGGGAQPPASPATAATALSLKTAGNAALAAGDAAAALAHYDAALRALRGCDEGSVARTTPPLAAVLHANKSVAALAAGEPHTALASARSATAAAPAWPKAWLRLVNACGAVQDAGGAAKAARSGMAAAAAVQQAGRAAGGAAAASAAGAAATAAAIRAAMDAIAVRAAGDGDYSAFDGAVLEVRPAAEGEEWLGLPAPPVAGEDDDGDEGGGGGGAPARRALPPPPGPVPDQASAPTPPGRSFRSLHAALAAAQDGDTVLLLPGTHNSLGASVVVARRVLISGGGLPGSANPLRSATLDGRGNVPAMRLGRAAVIHGLTVDASGFREGVRVEPGGWGVADVRGDSPRPSLPPTPAPLLVDCVVRASGDDGVAVLAPPGKPAPARPWTPSLVRCTLGPARRAGLRVRGGGAAVRLVGCVIHECTGPGLVVQGRGRADLGGGTRVERCGGGGLVVTGAGSRLEVRDSAVARCAGPALDASAGASALIGPATRLDGPDGGGLWAWGRGTAVHVDGGHGTALSSSSTFALLADGGAALSFGPGGCSVDGGVGGDGLARVTAVNPSAVPHAPPARAWVGPPPPAGCFVFTPDPLLA